VILPRAGFCADCREPIDYAGGHWQNVAPQGAREKIVCRRCWRLKHRKPPPLVTPGENVPATASSPIVEIVAALRALVARTARAEARGETQRELARWRNR
jgi:recombinational DNA repair protein (RecF pathway)